MVIAGDHCEVFLFCGQNMHRSTIMVVSCMIEQFIFILSFPKNTNCFNFVISAVL